MKNTTNNLIFYSLVLLAFLMLGATVIALMPKEASAEIVDSDYVGSGMRNVTYTYESIVEPAPRQTPPPTTNITANNNPTPVKTVTTTSTKSTTTTKSTTKAPTTTTDSAKENRDFGGLVAGAIFGGDGFMPSGIVQWLLLAIFILLIVIIVRKIFGEKQYHQSPLKHA